jgi:hypothetical protein
VAYPEAKAAILRREGIQCLEIGPFVEPFRGRIRDHALEVARTAGVEIQ